MKISIFIKTFSLLLLSMTALFLGSNYYLTTQFGQRYVDANVTAVSQAILTNIDTLEDDLSLSTSALLQASSETQYIRYQNSVVTASIGPTLIPTTDLLPFVIALYDAPDVVTDGKLSYTITLNNDVYRISYIYRFGASDYLLVLTNIQSLTNVDRVLRDISWTQAMVLFVTIVLLSFFLSRHIASPIRKINHYAKAMARLDFQSQLTLQRRDEFQELVSSLNEMAFNLKKSYAELDLANQQLSDDIAFEKQQETKKKQLIMTINHELKTPVAAIRGMVEGMIDAVGRYKDRDTYLRSVLEHLDKIDKMTKELTYSLKLEDLVKPHDHCSLNGLSSTWDTLRELAAQRQLQLVTKLKDGEVATNSELLAIAVTNLVKNAIHYSTSSKVVVTTDEQELHWVLEVRNGGRIEDDQFALIFQPYYRIQVEREGQGLGLFIVHQICELVHGSIKLFNDNGDVVAKLMLPKWRDVTPLP